MTGLKTRSARRAAEPRGTILIISLLLMVVAAFLGGLVLLMARTEGTLSSTSQGVMQATNAAEYGIELAINGLNPALAPTAFSTVCLVPWDPTTCDTLSRPVRQVWTTPGLRSGTNSAAQNLGVSACPPGYSLALGCSGYTFDATGWARAWLATTASVQLEKSESIYRGCNGTEYSC